jgi:hypothetical protein
MAKYYITHYTDYTLVFSYTISITILCTTYIKSKSIIDIKSGLSINHNYTIEYPHYWIYHKSSISTVSLTGLEEGL